MRPPTRTIFKLASRSPLIPSDPRGLIRPSLKTFATSSTDSGHHFRQLPRFYVPSSLKQAQIGTLVRLPPDETRHATKTLRMKQDDSLELCDGLGATVIASLASIASIDKEGALVRTTESVEFTKLQGWQWTVAVAAGSLKGDRSSWLVEKCTELGAASLLPLLTQRSRIIGAYSDDSDPKQQWKKKKQSRSNDDDEDADLDSGRLGRWQRVATAAMKQSLRTHAMQILPPIACQDLCSSMSNSPPDAAFIAMGGAPSIRTALVDTTDNNTNTRIRRGLLLIGPEGDFTKEEADALIAAGAVPVGLGDLRLRTETAAIALLTMARLSLL